MKGIKPLVALDVDDQGVHPVFLNGLQGGFPDFAAPGAVDREIERPGLEGGQGNLGIGLFQFRGGDLPPGVARSPQLQSLAAAFEAEGAVLAGMGHFGAQGDQGAFDGRLGLGVHDLADIGGLGRRGQEQGRRQDQAKQSKFLHASPPIGETANYQARQAAEPIELFCQDGIPIHSDASFHLPTKLGLGGAAIDYGVLDLGLKLRAAGPQLLVSASAAQDE